MVTHSEETTAWSLRAVGSPPPVEQRIARNPAGEHGGVASRRKLLMISFYYPPSNSSSGGLRPLKFSKYLREFGWDSTVLTVRESCHDSTDNALLQDIPPWVGVHRTRCFDAKTTFSIRGCYPGFLAVPDRYASWLPFAVRRAIRIVRREGIHGLFSTSPIPTAHLIALAVKMMTGTPWVSDFRDPWVETEGSEVHGRARQAVELWLERQVVQRADRILVTTREFGDYFCKRYGEAVREKIHAIYNGYDEDDFRGLPLGTTEPAGFTIVHAGLLDPNYRNPGPFLRALRQCLDRGVLPGDTRVRFIGGGTYAASGSLSCTVDELKLRDQVQLEKRIPYGQALASLVRASALLLLQGGDDTSMLIPAKAFEYLRTGRLILAAAPSDSATARLVRAFAGGFVADPSDPGDIAGKLAALFDAWARGAGFIDRTKDGLARYSRRAAASGLATILEQATAAAV